MRLLNAFILPLLAALSSILVYCHPLDSSSADLIRRTDGDVSYLPAREAGYLPAETELELRRIKESFNLAKRDQLDTRNPILIGIIRQAVVTIVRGLIQAIADDKLARADFTSSFISEARNNYPEFNWVICHVDHITQFDGVEGDDWGHGHEEFDIVIGGTVGYEVYYFGSGTFIRLGDGGFLNWAYGGNVISRTDSSDSQRAIVVFGPTV